MRLAYARTLVADKKYPEARGQFEQLIKDHPGNTDVVFAVAVLSMQLEDWPGAEANLKRLLDLGYADRNSVRYYLGQVTEEQKRFPEALQWYGEVTRSEQFMPAQIRTAQVMSKQGDLTAARKHLQSRQRCQQRPARAAHHRRGAAPARREPAEGGVRRRRERRSTSCPNNPDLLYDHAMLAEKLDRIDVLEASLRKVIKLRPDHAHAYNALGYSLADRNERLEEAKALIDQALKLAPDDSYIIDSLGWVLYRQGKPEEALKELQRAYAGRQDAEIAAHLGEVLWVLGRRNEAQKVWDEALAKTPSNDVLIKTVQTVQAIAARAVAEGGDAILPRACSSPAPRARSRRARRSRRKHLPPGSFAARRPRGGALRRRGGERARSRGGTATRPTSSSSRRRSARAWPRSPAATASTRSSPPTASGTAPPIRSASPGRCSATRCRSAACPTGCRAGPNAGVEAVTRYDGDRLAELRQRGWLIDYSGGDERPPKRVRLTRGDLDIRLVIDEWQLPPP